MVGELAPGVTAGCVDPDACTRNGKARSAVASAPGDQEEAHSNFPHRDEERKSFRGLQARFALLGLALHRTEEGLLLVDSVGRARALHAVEQAEQVLEEMGGAR